MILKSETYNFHSLDLARQAGFIVPVYDEGGLRLAATMQFSTAAEAFEEARKSIQDAGKTLSWEQFEMTEVFSSSGISWRAKWHFFSS